MPDDEQNDAVPRGSGVEPDAVDAEEIVRLASAQWAALLADPAARAELEAEDAFWDRLVGDGLPDERWPT